MKQIVLLLLIITFNMGCSNNKHSKSSKYPSYKGLVMAGYQGWFSTPTDGGNRGWYHYSEGRKFEPGQCSIDFWPDMEEYEIKYETAFKMPDGSAATVFSSYDKATVDLHFKWMQEYGIDGAFIQRFIASLGDNKNLNHNNTVLKNAINVSQKYNRAIAVMYDLSGTTKNNYKNIISDWKNLVDQMKLTNRGDEQTYLYHNGKPLIAIWGVGFNDNRKYGLTEVEEIIDFFKNDPVYGGCSILLGVPTFWRELNSDAINDTRLHDIIKKADIVQPWLVARFDDKSYGKIQKSIVEDIAWCNKNDLDYVPVVFPGFSWHNMFSNDRSNRIPRNKGTFFWQQLYGAINVGSEMIYIAMFDEIDEGTAIFKCSKKVPVGESTFVAIEEDVETDHYLWLSGQASKMLKKEIIIQEKMPTR